MTGLGKIALVNEEFDKAKKYFDEAFELHEKDGNQLYVSRGFRRSGILDLEQNNVDHAKTKFESALKTSKSGEIEREIAHNLISMSRCFIKEKNFKQAIELAKEAEILFDKYFDYSGYLKLEELKILLDKKDAKSKLTKLEEKAREKGYNIFADKLKSQISSKKTKLKK